MQDRIKSLRSGLVPGLFIAGALLAIHIHHAGAQSLGAADSFSVLAATTVTNTGSSMITGDVGVSPGSAITGFPPGVIMNGALHANDGLAMQAHADLATAYGAFVGLPSPPANNLSGTDLGGLTLAPGVYRFNTSATSGGILTFDAQGDPSARFVVQIGTTLITSSSSSVVLINGADARNIYFQVGSSATLGGGSQFIGNILANTSITTVGGTSVNGRLLAVNAAVTLDSNSVTNPGPTPPPIPSQLLNISTRLNVQTGEDVSIVGFIISGNAPKQVIVRGIGPSISGISPLLADPVIELHGPNGSLITSNDNWKDSQQVAIEQSGVAPTKDQESAIVATLVPGGYTAIVSGKGGATGIGLVEMYDLDVASDSQLANISSRGFVQTGDNVMIGGFIFGLGTASESVLMRAIGPSLAQDGVADALADPTLELRDGNGALLLANDNWADDPDQAAAIIATGLPPQNSLESALVATLPPAPYTAIVAGKDGTAGVALVEVYHLR